MSEFEEKILKFWCCEVPPDSKDVDEAVCNAARILASTIFDLVPECPERTLAIRRLQECRFWVRQAFCCELDC